MNATKNRIQKLGFRSVSFIYFSFFLCGFSSPTHASSASDTHPTAIQSIPCLLEQTPHALSYSGYRDGQRPGGAEPSDEQLLEDLQLLATYPEFHLIRIYSAESISKRILDLITEHHLPIKVMLGIWLGGEIDNHENCPWQAYPAPPEALKQNTILNDKQLEYGITLANAYPDVVAAVNVGNEVLAPWSGQLISEDRMLELVLKIKASIQQPVTIADSFEYWMEGSEALVDSLDFIAVHIYPQWEGYDIDSGIAFVDTHMRQIKARYPNKPLAITETGWSTVADEFDERASEPQQTRYFNQILEWSKSNHVTTFWFSGFDAKWKGTPEKPNGAEKHWGLFYSDRTPKPAISSRQ